MSMFSLGSIESLKVFLTKTSTLKVNFYLYIVSTLLFGLIMYGWNFQIIDELFDAQVILDHVKLLSAKQKTVHIITTATLDVVYPFIYGIFQAGMAYRFLGTFGCWVAPLSIICIPVDLVEGFIQVMLLNGFNSLVGLKTIITPLKLGLFLPGLAFALIAAGIAIFQAKRR